MVGSSAEREPLPEGTEARLADFTELSRIGVGLAGVMDDLREVSHGLHPAVLSRGGLKSALKVLARRSAVPVELDVPIDKRLPEEIEATAYYVVSEGLTNTAKHAPA